MLFLKLKEWLSLKQTINLSSNFHQQYNLRIQFSSINKSSFWPHRNAAVDWSDSCFWRRWSSRRRTAWSSRTRARNWSSRSAASSPSCRDTWGRNTAWSGSSAWRRFRRKGRDVFAWKEIEWVSGFHQSTNSFRNPNKNSKNIDFLFKQLRSSIPFNSNTQY